MLETGDAQGTEYRDFSPPWRAYTVGVNVPRAGVEEVVQRVISIAPGNRRISMSPRQLLTASRAGGCDRDHGGRVEAVRPVPRKPAIGTRPGPRRRWPKLGRTRRVPHVGGRCALTPRPVRGGGLGHLAQAEVYCLGE